MRLGLPRRMKVLICCSSCTLVTRAAAELLPRVTGQDPATSMVTTLQQEKQFNTFFRLTSPAVIEALRESFPDLPEQPDAKTVFVKLRELRNKW